MNPLDALIACVGAWKGLNTLQDPNTGKPEESTSVLTVTPVLAGRFVRLDYDWSHQGSPQEGSLLFGFVPKTGEASAYWVDAWHMGRKGLTCSGGTTEHGLSVRGSYAAPPGPDWGWRIEVEIAGDELKITHTNIDGDGEESPAVEASYTRA